MHVVVTVVAALAGAALLELLRVPAGALIGGMLGVTAVNLSPIAVATLPRPVQFLAFAGIGWLVGQGITREILQQIARHIGFISVTVVTLLAVGAIIAVVLVRLDVLDPATAFLATSPGGLSQMVALSAAVGANAPMVVTVHVARLVTVLLLSPLVLRLLPSPT